MTPFPKRLLAEVVGTFSFVLVGAGSSVASSSIGLNQSASLLVAALANGLGLAVAVSSTMAISGGHINPAVSISLAVAGKFKLGELLPYILAQLFGSLLAAYTLSVSLPFDPVNASHIGSPSLSVGVLQGILLEAVMTFVLVIAVFGTAVDQRAPKIAGFGIGIAVLTDVLLGGPFTGAAMNPARAMGPMIVSGFMPYYWYVYWIGPIIGGLIAGLLYRYLQD
jgi:MIP family channel proteins